MKKVLTLFITLVLIASSIFTVSANQSVSFEISNCTCDTNRLFTVNIVAKSDIKLSAATFEFTYDKNLFEFRSAKVTDEESKISYNELDSYVKAVFLNPFGKDIKNGDTIFTLTFKSISSGTGYIDFTVSDCVSPDIEFIEIGNCKSGSVTVNGKQAEDNDSKNESSKSSSKTDKSSNSKKSEKDTETTSASTIDELGTLNPIDDRTMRYFIAGICMGTGVVIFIMIIYFVSRKIISKRKDKDYKSSD